MSLTAGIGREDTGMFEKRIMRDANGFYQVQIRMLPVQDWQGEEVEA